MAIDWENLTRQQTGVVLKTLLEQITTEELTRTAEHKAVLSGFEALDDRIESLVNEAVAAALADPATARLLWAQRRRPSVVK